MNRKKFKKKVVMSKGPNFRWTNDDIEAGWPERFKAALDKSGYTFASAARAMFKGFTEEVEERGRPGPINRGINAALSRIPKRDK